jgi:hypothetical protein
VSNYGVDLGTSAAKQFVVGKLRGAYSETPDDSEAVAELLTGPTEGRVHASPVPDTYPLPFVTFVRYGGGDDPSPIGRNQPTVATTVRLQVKAICEGYDDSPIEAAAAMINRLLDGSSALVDLTKQGGGSYGTFYVECNRESELLTDLPPEDDGTVYQQLGGVYAFFVTRAG